MPRNSAARAGPNLRLVEIDGLADLEVRVESTGSGQPKLASYTGRGGWGSGLDGFVGCRSSRGPKVGNPVASMPKSTA